MNNEANELRNEIADCTWAIKAFRMGMKWLAPGGYEGAPSIEWLEMQRRGLRARLQSVKEAATLGVCNPS
jgi:hypothetical protein